LERAERDETSLPPLDHDGVTITDPAVGEATNTGRNRRDRPEPGLGPPGPVDHQRREQLQRLIGRRGEQTVFEAEKRRVAASGQDPNRVVWRSSALPFAPYDIERRRQRRTRLVQPSSSSADRPGLADHR
jgi:hypothetical protein